MSDEVIDYLDVDGQQMWFGWDDKPDVTAEIVASLPCPTLEDTPIGDIPVGELPKEVNFTKFVNKVLGLDYLNVEQQGQVGTCVSFGTARGIEYTNIVEIANGEQETFHYLCRPLIYGGSRVEANGGRAAFRGDGSTGSLAAKWVTNWGVLPKDETIEGYDLSLYSPSLCREWGSRGVPNVLEPYAKQHPVKNATLITSVEAAQRALSNGYAMSICSTQGFTTRRDTNGICGASGSWAHCMALVGYIWINNKLYFAIENSWGRYMNGPKPPNFNEGTFLASADIVARMLRQNDSFAFSGLTGFNKRDIDWDF